jgi:hypothetical protein
MQFDVSSAFRPCGRDLAEFFNNTVWASSVKLTVSVLLTYDSLGFSPADVHELPRTILHLENDILRSWR